MKHIRNMVLAAVIAVFPALAFAAPAKDLVKMSGGADVPAVKAASAQLERAPKREWTIMIFNNAKNNLEPIQLKAMNALEFLGSAKDVNIVLELGRLGHVPSDGGWKGIRRYYITKDNDSAKINSPVMWQTPREDMGNYNRVIDFANWAAYNFPAKRYVLIIANHGYGWLDQKSSGSRGISYDEESGNFIRTTEMAAMLDGVNRAIGKRLDIYYSAACLMSSVEVAYEIRNQADVIIGSEEVAMTSSVGTVLWPNVVKAILDSPTLSTDNLAKATADYYVYGLKSINQSGTLSAVRGMYMEGLADELDSWAAAAMAFDDPEAVKTAKSSVLRFYVPLYADLGDFMEFYAWSLTPDPAKNRTAKQIADFKKYTTDVVARYKNNVVVRNAVVGRQYKMATGLTISIPMDDRDSQFSWNRIPAKYEAYNKLAFGKNHKWKAFCDYLESVK